MSKHWLFLCMVMFTFSCTRRADTELCSLEKTDKIIAFPVMGEVRVPQSSVSVFSDNGKVYLSYQNLPKNEILVYSMDSQKLVKKLCINTEGDNSVPVGFGGYYMVDMHHVFIPSLYVNTIYVVDTLGKVKQKIAYEKTRDNRSLKPFIPSDKCQMFFIDNHLYIPQTINLRLGDKAVAESPVRVVIDTVENTVDALPMRFPPLITSKDIGTSANGCITLIMRFPPLITSKDIGTVGAFGAEYACCYDGDRFIYSFNADEDLYLTDPEHKSVEKKKAKSRYIERVSVFRSNEEDFQKMVKAQCEHASYGKILYDKYRRLYYRFAYPPCEIDDYTGDYIELLRSGRKSFSVMILDEQLNVLGETLFPAYTYNSNLSFVLEDGLYISLNHIKNPEYSDDMLRFQRLKLRD